MATVSANLALVGEDVGEVDGHGLGVNRGDHLFARLHFDQLRACLANLVVKSIAMALLDDDLVPREIRDVGNGVHAGLKVLGHHAGVADDHGRGCAARH
jgi:hypothetical protein